MRFTLLDVSLPLLVAVGLFLLGLALTLSSHPTTADNARPVVENQLGYKMIKWIERIEFIASERLVGVGEGGSNEDEEYFDLLPNI